MTDLKDGASLVGRGIEFLGLRDGSGDWFFQQDIHACRKKVLGYAIMGTGGHGDTDRLNPTQEIMVAVQRPAAGLRGCRVTTSLVDVYHPDEFRLGARGG